MTIFIGRNIEERSKIWLRQRRVDYVAQPLIDVQLNVPDYSFFHKIEARKKQWFITSRWAAKWLNIHYSNIGFSSNDSVFCLSEKQAEIIRGFSDAVFISKERNSKSLSDLLFDTKGLKIFLRGNRSLEASGLEIIEVEVYQNSLTKATVGNDFGAYLFFSPSGIESFIQGKNVVSEHSIIITIGETTARKARAEFPNEVFVSVEQSEWAMVKLAVTVLNKEETKLI